MKAPHYLFFEYRGLCLAALIVSLLLSLAAIYMDPVVNNDGILYIEAADHFRSGDWAAGFSLYKWPFYSLVIAAAGAVPGIAGGHAAYATNAVLYVVLVLGFVALVRAMGGQGRVLWLALAVALLHPVLNEYRPFIIRDVGYWACYLWSLAYFFTYLRTGHRRLLLFWALFSLFAFLFRVEGVLLITLLPALLLAGRLHGRQRLSALAAAFGIAALILGGAPLWQYVSEVDITRQSLASNPLGHVIQSWNARGSEILDRLHVLQREFPGISSNVTAFAAYFSTVLFLILFELVRTLGVVFSGLVVFGLARYAGFFPEGLRNWWWLIAGIQGLLVFQFAFSNFFLAERYTAGLALTLLVVVPFCLDRLLSRWRGSGVRVPWPGAVLILLLLVEAGDGIDVRTDKLYLKEAGLWLRRNADSHDTIYSNSRILVYYSGLRETGSNAAYTWREAMSILWTDRWREYDYFVLDMKAANSRNRVLLMKRIESRPVRRFRNSNGDSALIFSSTVSEAY